LAVLLAVSLTLSGCSCHTFVAEEEAIRTQWAQVSETFNRLMDELAGTENRIAVERMRYNERVQEYNTLRRQFPSNVTAGVFGFREYAVFNAPPEAERVPRVDFGRPGA